MTTQTPFRGRHPEPQREPPVVAGRVPPHDLEAEAAVLSSCLLDRDALDRVLELLQPEHFYSDAHRLVFEASRALSTDGAPVDVVSVASWLRSREQIQRAGGASYLGQLVDATPAVANVTHYARVVKEKWRLRRVIAVCQKYAAEGYGDVGTPQQFIDSAEQAIYDIARTPESSTVHHLKDVLTTTFQQISAAAERGDAITGVPTRFIDLDRKTAGLHPGDLVVVAARPGMGKTSFVLNVAVNVASAQLVQTPGPGDRGYGTEPSEKPGWGVAVFSLEMPKEQVAARMVCSEARVDVGKLRQGRLSPDDWANLTGAASVLANLPIWIDDSPALGMLELRAKVRRLKADYGRHHGDEPGSPGLGLVVIDYLQLMSGRPNASSREQEISEISRGLKQLAKELSVPVIALSQLNRGVETRGGKDKRPMLSDLRECVTGDTLVLLADGRRMPIAELVGRRPDVIAMNEDRKLSRATSDKVWCVGKRSVFRVSLASGRALRATARHRLYGANGWVRVGDLEPGDRLAIARATPEPIETVRWPDDHVVLLGHLIGDGSYLKGQPLRYTTASQENSDAVAEAASCSFGVTVTRHEGKGKWHQLVFSGNGNRWHPAGMNKWLRDLGVFDQRSHQKRIPDSVFRLGNDQVTLLLRHLWATDGTIFARASGKGSSTVCFSTNSRGLADDVSALLLRIGIVARIHEVRQREYRTMFTVNVSGASQQRRFLEVVGGFGPKRAQAAGLARLLRGVSDNTNVDTLPREVFSRVKERMAELGISQRRMAALRGTSYGGTSHFKFAPTRAVMTHYAALLAAPDLAELAHDDLFWDRVVAVEPCGKEAVYDLTVPGPASWLADAVVSHNSGAIEQDADTIIFIYRDEYYNRDATTDRGIAELIIAKQRNGPTGTLKARFISSYTRFENLAPGEYDQEEELGGGDFGS